MHCASSDRGRGLRGLRQSIFEASVPGRRPTGKDAPAGSSSVQCHQVTAFKRMDAVPLAASFDRRHDGSMFARLDVRNEDIDTGLQVLEFAAQACRMQMPAALRYFALFVGKGGFDDELCDVNLGQPPPEPFIGPSVSGENPAAPVVRAVLAYGKPHCRDRVHGWKDFDAAARQRERLSDFDRVQAQYRRLRGRQPREVRPDDVIEDVASERFKCRAQSVNTDGRPTMRQALAHHAVGQERNPGNMVEVGVADQDVVDTGQLRQGQVTHARAGVDEDRFIEKEAGCLASGSDGSGTSEYAQGHDMRGALRGPA